MPAQTKFEVKLGAATREAFGRALVELGRESWRITERERAIRAQIEALRELEENQ